MRFTLSLLLIASLTPGILVAEDCCPLAGPLRMVALSRSRVGDLGAFCTSSYYLEAREAVAAVLPQGSTCTETDELTPTALTDTDVVVVTPAEAATPMPSELDALRDFLLVGGSMILVAENSRFVPWNNAIGSLIGATFAATDIGSLVLHPVSHPILDGPAGSVSAVEVAAGGAMDMVPSMGTALGDGYLGSTLYGPSLFAMAPGEGLGCGAVVVLPDINTMLGRPYLFPLIQNADNRAFVGNTFHWIDSIHRNRADVDPPIFGPVQVSAVLWPPNHKWIELHLGAEIQATVEDACDPSPQLRIVDVRSNEPADDQGDGRTLPDYRWTEDTLWLRSERDGRATGRIYTIVFEARDASGNSAVQSFEIHVEHDQGGGNPLP